ncbi:hypothetical protein KUCAC02_020656 [Chaenocephalus aceratus]|uniref:Uncharacterized protein n=1 Tax=Chaenocephalus aceratus TaxID=36190 RepID=A0ACB9XEU8_CHAAC|nr:hypothetical protein KUCAC02_020656 [Chaenocephalus aceratus]
MKNYKALDSYKLLESGWVQTVRHIIPDDTTLTVLRADVTPSFRVNEPPHHPWAAVTQRGDVVAAHCDCKAGLGESCSHIGGLLYKVEMIVRVGGARDPACTDVLCTWNEASMKGVQTARVADINFYGDKPKEKVVANNAPARRADPQPVSSDVFEDFLVSLLAASNPVMPVGLSLFGSTSSNFAPKKAVVPSQKVPPGLRSLYRGVEGFNSLDEVYSAATQTMKLDHKDVEHIGNVTKLQSKSLVWYEQRAGRITSSVSHSVLRTSTTKPSQYLIKSICCDRPSNLKTTAIVWGNEHEQVARQQYADGAISSVHSDLKVNNCGLLIKREQPFLAASPDAMLACSCHGMGVLEIKCPFKFREMSVEEMSKEKDSCRDQNLELKESHQYYTQTQHQMYVTGASYCEFLMWLPTGGHVCTVFPDKEYTLTSVPVLTAFWEGHVRPELLFRKLELSTKQTEHGNKQGHCLDLICRIGKVPCKITKRFFIRPITRSI